MKRELKFREWMPTRNKFHYWGLIDGAFFGPSDPRANHQQFTGLKDKNGKEIYEGDILRYTDGSDKSTHKIFWDDKQARWWDTRVEDGDSNTAYYEFEFVKECVVIGNIYESPEKLNDKPSDNKGGDN